MGNVRIKVDDAAIGQLTGLPDAQRLLDRCANAALSFQKATCPVDTGSLVRHLEIDMPSPDVRRIGVLRPHPPLTDATKYVRYVEEGHESRAGNWVPAQPFIRPSTNAARKGLGN